MLPVGSGIDLLHFLQRSPGAPPVRIAVITSASKNLLDDARKLNPHALFRKPLNVTALIEWMAAAPRS